MKQPEIEGQPDYEEMFQKMVEALPVERRLAGLTSEERLAGLAPWVREPLLDLLRLADIGRAARGACSGEVAPGPAGGGSPGVG